MISEALQRPIGPLAAWQWGLVVGGGYLGYRVLSGKSLFPGGSSSGTTVGTTSGGAAVGDPGYGTGGAIGPQGIPGEMGPTGPQGDTGLPGLDATPSDNGTGGNPIVNLPLPVVRPPDLPGTKPQPLPPISNPIRPPNTTPDNSGKGLDTAIVVALGTGTQAVGKALDFTTPTPSNTVSPATNIPSTTLAIPAMTPKPMTLTKPSVPIQSSKTTVTPKPMTITKPSVPVQASKATPKPTPKPAAVVKPVLTPVAAHSRAL